MGGNGPEARSPGKKPGDAEWNNLLNAMYRTLMSQNEYHQIPIKRETAEQLQNDKRLGESWDDVVRRRLLNDES